MKLHIEWRYPEEVDAIGADFAKKHEHTFYDINPKSISIEYGQLYFEANENPNDKHWLFPISHVVKMKMEEE